MLHYNNLFNLITNRLVHKGETQPLSTDPLAEVDLSQAPESVEKPAKSKKGAKETAEEAQRKVQEEVGKRKVEYNKKKFDLEVEKAKLEVERKVDEQLGGLMNDIQESANQGELNHHYKRAVTTLMNMQHEISALKFIKGGVDVPADNEYAKELKETMNVLTAKAKKMEVDGHPEIGGLTFDQIVDIMIDARTEHYNSYPMDYFKDAKLQIESELKEPSEADAELASLLGETPEGEGQKVKKVKEAKPMTEVDNAIASYRNQLEKGSTNTLAQIMTNLKQVSDAYANALKDNPSDVQAEMVTAVMNILGGRTEGTIYSNILFLEQIANEVSINPGDSSKVIGQKIFDQFKNVPTDKNKKAYLQSQFLNLFS